MLVYLMTKSGNEGLVEANVIRDGKFNGLNSLIIRVKGQSEPFVVRGVKKEWTKSVLRELKVSLAHSSTIPVIKAPSDDDILKEGGIE